MGKLVGTKSKKTKLVDNTTPPDPITTTNWLEHVVCSSDKEQHHSQLGVTAIAAVMQAGTDLDQAGHHISSKKVPRKKIIKVLIDSGSDGDLLFHEKGTGKHFPYLTRQVPKSWCTSNGVFTTKGKASVQVKFFEYSNSKRVKLTPDVVEYEEKTMGKPVFDLIVGTKTLNELGIVLDFKHKIITLDIKFPMRSITELPSSRKKALASSNSLAKSKEPRSIEEATQRVVRILDANYKKADLQAIVKDNCKHLSSNNQEKILRLLTEFEPLLMEH
jgi:hypothetical protein